MPLTVHIEFSGGAELLFNNIKKHDIRLPDNQSEPWTLSKFRPGFARPHLNYKLITVPIGNGEKPQFYGRERLKTPKTDCALKFTKHIHKQKKRFSN